MNNRFGLAGQINEHFGIFSPEAREYLKNLNSQFNKTDIIDEIKSLNKLNVLIIGDAIIDEYLYTTGLGQSAKVPTYL